MPDDPANQEEIPLTVYAFVSGYGRVMIPVKEGSTPQETRNAIIDMPDSEGWIEVEPGVGGPALDVRLSAITAVWLRRR